MPDPGPNIPWEVRLIWRGLQVLTVLSFGAFFALAVYHLATMFLG